MKKSRWKLPASISIENLRARTQDLLHTASLPAPRPPRPGSALTRRVPAGADAEAAGELAVVPGVHGGGLLPDAEGVLHALCRRNVRPSIAPIATAR